MANILLLQVSVFYRGIEAFVANCSFRNKIAKRGQGLIAPYPNTFPQEKARDDCCEGTQRRTKRGTGQVSGTSVAPSQHALIIYAY